MTVRTVRVVLSGSAGPFLAEMRKAREGVLDLAKTAESAKVPFASLTATMEKTTKAANELATSGRKIGTKFGESVTGVDRLRAAVEKLSTSRGLDHVIDQTDGLRLALMDAMAPLAELRAELRLLRMPAGGFEGANLMRTQIEELQAQLLALRRTAARPMPIAPAIPGAAAGTAVAGASARESGGILSGHGLIGSFVKYQVGYAAITAVGKAIKSAVTETANYETQINILGAVTQTTGKQLSAAGDLAIKLGGDVTIANADATDAAQTMTELSKGGMSLSGAMIAAKGSMQLAAAGGITFVAAADDMSSAIAQFQTGAQSAGTIADSLANAANAAKGNLGDFAEGLKQAGAEAHLAGWSIQETLGSLALLSKGGLGGAAGGNALKQEVIRLQNAFAKPDTAAGKALKTLGIEVYDANGKMISAVGVTAALQNAHQKLAPAIYNSAANALLGTRAIVAGNIEATLGAKSLQNLTDKVYGGAGAAAYSAAKMSGLQGAFLNLQNQTQTAAVEIGEKFSPALQTLVRGIADAVPKITAFFTGSGFKNSIGGFFDPLITGIKAAVTAAWPYIQDFFSKIGSVIGSVVDFFQPIIKAFGNVYKAAADNGTVARVSNTFDMLGTALKDVAKFLAPIGNAFAHVITFIGGLGTLGQTLVTVGTAMLAFKLLSPLLTGVAKLVPGFSAASKAITNTGNSYKYLRSMANMGPIAAGAAAAGNAIANVGKGVVAAFGGPVGLAITGVVTAISLFSGHTSDASKRTQVLSDDNLALVDSFNQVTSAATDATHALIIDQLQKDGSLGKASALKLDTSLLTDAILGNAGAQRELNAEVNTGITGWVQSSDQYKTVASDMTAAGVSAQDLATGMVKGNNSIALDKWNALKESLGRGTVGFNRMNSEQSQVSQLFKDGAEAVKPYNEVLGDLSDRAKGVVSDQEAIKQKTIAANTEIKRQQDAFKSLSPILDKVKYPTQELIDVHKGLYDATAQMLDLGAAVPLTQLETFNQWASTVPGIEVKVDDKGTLLGFQTRADAAFASAGVYASNASRLVALFWYNMADPNQVSAIQTINAAGQALDALGASIRDKSSGIANVAALTTARDTVANKHTGRQSDGTDYSAAQKARDLAQANRDLITAQDGVAEADGKIFDAQVAVGQIESTRIQQIYDSTKVSSGAAAAVIAVNKEINDKRAAFIAKDETDNHVSAIKAGQDADFVGLKANGAMALLTKSTGIVLDLAAQTKWIAEKTAADKVIRFTADLKTAQTDITSFGTDVSKFPVEVKTKFDAAVTDAKKDGKDLYDTYDKAKGTWTAEFLTPSQAAAKQKAGDLVTEYNKAKGNWDATFTMKDFASTGVASLKKTMDTVTDREVSIKVLSGYTPFATSTPVSTLQALHGDTIPAKAKGGPIHGPGSGTSDDVPIWGSDGEFMSTAVDYKRNKGAIDFIHAGGTIKAYAEGGQVGWSDTKRNDTTAITANMTGESGLASSITDFFKTSIAAITAAAQQDSNANGGAVSGGNTPSAVGAGAVRAAESQLGVPYVYAEAIPGVGFDCSGLTQWAYAQVGVALQHYSGAQAVGLKVAQADLQPGDLTVWDGHVNMYIGNGQIIEAPQPGENVHERPLYTSNQGDPFLGFYRPAVLAKNYVPSVNTGVLNNKDAPSAVPPGVTGGAFESSVERWRPEVDQAYLAKGFPVSQDYILMNQMKRESDGNPDAKNLTDSNAQAGHPSVGVLQFIPSTFAAYADPGFNTNIMDPESQFRAFLNYVPARYGTLLEFAGRGYGAYAGGGKVRGPGSGTSDDVPIWGSDGEFMSTAADYKRNQGAIDFIHSGGTIKGYATGGVISPLGLSGRANGNYGTETALVIQALVDIRQAVTDLQQATVDKQAIAATAFTTLNDSKAKQYTDVQAAEQKLADVRATVASHTAKASASEAARIKVASARVAVTQGVIDADMAGISSDKKRAKDRAANVKAQAALDAIGAAHNASTNGVADAISLATAQRNLDRIRKLDAADIAKNHKDYVAAVFAVTASKAAATAAAAYEASQAANFVAQQQRAIKMDALTGGLAAQTTKLAQMRTDRFTMAQGVSNAVSGFDGGILGHPDTRNTYATIMKGQAYDELQAAKFTGDLNKLRKLGLSNASLQSIGNAGIDGGAVTAHALAGASKAQIAKLNATTSKISALGGASGNTVAGAAYDSGIAVGQGLVNGLNSQIGALQKVMIRYADVMTTTLSAKLKIHSPSMVMHELGRNVGHGFRNGIVSTHADSAHAMSGLVSSLAAMPTAGPRSAPTITVYLGTQQITDLVRVEIDGHDTQLVTKFRNARGQS